MSFGGSNDSEIPGEAWTCTHGHRPRVAGARSPPKILRVRDTLRDQAQIVGCRVVDPIAEGWLANRRLAPMIRNALK